MSGIPPVVRHMLLCDEVRKDPDTPFRVDLLGVRHTMQASGNPPFPFRAPPFLVFLRMAGARGTGRYLVEIRHADTRETMFTSGEKVLTFSASPLAVVDMTLAVRQCVFPRPGLYLVQFRSEDRLLAQEFLTIK